MCENTASIECAESQTERVAKKKNILIYISKVQSEYESTTATVSGG